MSVGPLRGICDPCLNGSLGRPPKFHSGCLEFNNPREGSEVHSTTVAVDLAKTIGETLIAADARSWKSMDLDPAFQIGVMSTWKWAPPFSQGSITLKVRPDVRCGITAKGAHIGRGSAAV